MFAAIDGFRVWRRDGVLPRTCERLLVCAVLLLSLSGCGSKTAGGEESGDASTAAPILLIGIDGMEWDMAVPLLARGRLPNLAKLMERGSYGLLQSFRPTESPVIWTSIATGKVYSKHGILHFVRRGPGGNVSLYSSSDRRTKALWNIVSDYHKRVCTIGWWMTYPVEPINGVMVAQTNTAAQLDTRGGRAVWKGALMENVPGQVYPPQRQAEMIAELEAVEQSLPELTHQIFGEFRAPLSLLGERLWNNCLWAFQADATYARITRRLLAERPAFDLSMVYFGGPDVVGHRFWRYTYPDLYQYEPAPDQIQNFGKVIEDYYAYIDRKVGDLLAASGPDTTVMVVSDHGMKPINLDVPFDAGNPPADVNSAHHKKAPPGIFVAAGPCIRRWEPGESVEDLRVEDLATVGSVYDITPTILALLRIPVGKDMDGHVLTGLIRDGFDLNDEPPPVVTHDTPEFLISRPQVPRVAQRDEERLRQLRELGYITDEEPAKAADQKPTEPNDVGTKP